jgi:hypothetical protein
LVKDGSGIVISTDDHLDPWRTGLMLRGKAHEKELAPHPTTQLENLYILCQSEGSKKAMRD